MSGIEAFFQNIADQFYYSVVYEQRYLFLLEGLKNTLIISFFAVLLGILIGLIIAVVRNSAKEFRWMKPLDGLCRFYVSVVRGTPALLQLMIIYYVIFQSVDVNLLLVGALAFGINSGAYVSEIIRAGLDSVDVGQVEAGRSLGFSYFQTMRFIVMPQAIRNILPALGNEFITLLKETSVAGYIGIMELTKASDVIASRTYNYFFPLIVVALIYLVMTLGLSKLIHLFERKLKTSDTM